MNLRIETWWDLTEIAECIKKQKKYMTKLNIFQFKGVWTEKPVGII